MNWDDELVNSALAMGLKTNVEAFHLGQEIHSEMYRNDIFSEAADCLLCVANIEMQRRIHIRLHSLNGMAGEW